MPIDDVDIQGSAGWWFKKLARRQADRLPQLERLHERYIGNAPLPNGPKEGEAAYNAFQKLARTAYEDTIVRAVLDRQTPTAFRTAAEDDAGGDRVAARVWAANEMPVAASEILESKLSMREGYAIIGPPDPGDPDRNAIITPEDPREVITAHDPVRPSRVRAGLKVFHDPDEGLEVAYVYMAAGATRQDGGKTTRATVRRAQRKARTPSLVRSSFTFSPSAWEWAGEPEWGDTYRELNTTRCPIVRFQNRNGLAEFEKHVDLIDRIRHTILQRMVIVTMQAFRQRAVKGLPDRYPKDYPVPELVGKPIDYSTIFTADPAAIWLLPPGTDGKAVELWESGVLELTGVLNSVKDDIREMAAVSRTPFYEFVPDGANQTAEGAVTQREGITFKVEDHNTRDGIALAQVMSLAFEQMGDAERAKVGQIQTIWAPVERYSLAMQADAAQKAKGIRPTRAILEDIYQLTPAQAQREMDMLADDFLLSVTGDQLPLGGNGTGTVRVPSTRTDRPGAADGEAAALGSGDDGA